MKNRHRLISLILLVTLIGCSSFKGPTEKELLLQIQVQELQKELAEENNTVIIENPTLEELTRQETIERTAIRNEIQQANKKLKDFNKKKKLEEELKKAEESQEATTPAPIIPRLPVVSNLPSTNSKFVEIKTKKSPLTLRSDSTTNSKALKAIPKGTKVEYGQTKQIDGYTWYNVEYGNKNGWIRGDFTKKVN